MAQPTTDTDESLMYCASCDTEVTDTTAYFVSDPADGENLFAKFPDDVVCGACAEKHR